MKIVSNSANALELDEIAWNAAIPLVFMLFFLGIGIWWCVVGQWGNASGFFAFALLMAALFYRFAFRTRVHGDRVAKTLTIVTTGLFGYRRETVTALNEIAGIYLAWRGVRGKPKSARPVLLLRNGIARPLTPFGSYGAKPKKLIAALSAWLGVPEIEEPQASA